MTSSARPQQRRRDRQAERLGGLEVDDELELLGLLDGHVAGLGPFEDLVLVACGTPKQVRNVGSISQKAASIHSFPPWVHCWQPVLRCEVCEASSLTEEHDACQHTQAARMRSGHFREGPVEIGGTSRLNDLKPRS